MGGPGGAGDRYVRKRVLGEGGAGRVWLVEDRQRPGHDLALKELVEAGTPQHEEGFRREFATLACLHHPNLVEVEEFDVAPDTGLPRFTLEFIQGRGIVDAVRREGPGAFLELAVEALRALAFLHDFDLIHRDLKPANLLVRDAPKLGCRLVVVDFGLALRGEADRFDAARPMGTLPYLAPELFANRAASRRSDLFALGAVLFEAVHGRAPVVLRDAGSGAFVREAQGVVRGGGELPAEYPEGLRGWLSEMLSPDPERRPATAGEALARLNDACGTSHPAETPATRTARLLSGPPAEREGDIARIRTELDPSAGPRVVWLCGGPGTGKSRVLRWLEAEAILRGWHVVSAQLRPRWTVEELRERARSRPTLVLLDEVHAAGAGTVALLDRIARDGNAPPVQVVAALRPEGIERAALAELVAGTGTIPTLRRCDLGAIDADGVRAMACRATGGLVAEERVQWLLEASEGSPARVESLLIEGAWERGGRTDAASRRAPVPWGRLELVSPGATAWLEGAAVLRAEATEAQAAALSGLDPGAARDAAEEAAAAGLAHRKDGRWFLESSAIAEQLVSRMGEGRRRALHRAAAELLAAGRGEDADPGRLARLWAGAGEPARAAACFVSAAERSEAAGDPAGAAAAYADALRLSGRADPARPTLRRRQAEALMRAGRYAAAARAWGAVVRLARDASRRHEPLARQALALVQAGRFSLALGVARRAAQGAAAAGDADGLAQANQAAGIVLGRLGREAEAIPLLEEVRAALRSKGDARGEADVAAALAACRSRVGDERAERDFEEAIALYRRARESGREPLDGQDLKARVGLAVIRIRDGRHDEAAAILEEVHAAAVAQGNLNLREVALSKLSALAIDQGKLDRAIALAEQAADLALHLGDHNLILVNHCRLADAQIRCGRAGEAVVRLRQTLERPLARVEPENVDYARMLLANAWMESGGGDEALVRALLDQSLARCRERRKLRAWLMALVIEMERRARPDCPDPFEPVRTEFDALVRGAGDPPDAEIRIRAFVASAAFHLARGSAAAAREQATEAVEIARVAGYPAFQARACAVLASALERGGREREAAGALEEGRRLLERAAARIDDARVRAGFLERPVFATLREGESLATRRNRGRLATLYDMIRVLNSETEPDGLLETILDLALRAVGAERGMILLREDREGPGQGEFSVHLARGLENETVRDAESYSRGIVAAAGTGRSLLALDAGSDARFRDLRSVSLYRIRSLMCVPLRARDRIVGTVYIDSRKEGELFTDDDLRFVEAFADQAAVALENARMRARLEQQNRQLLAAAEARTEFANLVGRSPGMRAVFALVEKVAATDLPVMIRGESGTGKELVARAIHAHGPRRRRPFLGENCAAIPEGLLESALFGHVRGAFTGADRDRPGLFEQVDGGTLFLDEVGDMPAAMQARLLRVLEEGKVRRVGGEKTIAVDVRVVTATHRDLGAEIKAGRFRQDLLYRLQVLTIEIPPLRERPGDIALLAAHFLERIGRERGRPPAVLDDEALALFERYSWPGNVRELQNTLQRLALLAGQRSIGASLIGSDPLLRRTLIPRDDRAKAAFSLKSAEREQLRHALAAAQGNRSRAAGLLGVSRATLYRKLRQHGL